jgi:ESS family glutamate:Na+ symporter
MIEVSGFLTFTISILVFFAGMGLNRALAPLRRWNIPEAVTGGLIAAVATFAIHRAFDLSVTFDLDARDTLLLYFFTGIGLNARASDLLSGGRPLILLLALTLAFLVLQNVVASSCAALLGLPKGVAALLGSVSLVGGHGTTIAWAPVISERFALPNALEIGIASATLGLVVASLLGGPLAGLLISRFKLSGQGAAEPVIGLPENDKGPDAGKVTHVGVLSTLLVLNVAILVGFALEEIVAETGVKLPLFVVCLLVAIVLANTIPRLLPGFLLPTRTRALALISDLSLNIFLVMSLMSMQLWSLEGLGLALAAIIAIQALLTVAFILFAVFPIMGRNYLAAVLAAGFTGIGLGATPTAIANMTAVTKVHGPAPTAFIILPLVSAFFIDLANAVAIGFMLR